MKLYILLRKVLARALMFAHVVNVKINVNTIEGFLKIRMLNVGLFFTSIKGKHAYTKTYKKYGK